MSSKQLISNKSIAKQINLLGKLMELHQENIFRVKSYYSAYNALRRIDSPFSEMSDNEILSLPGVGSTILDKIRELCITGTIQALEKYKSITPPGVIELLSVRGLGPKKVRTVWLDMQIEDPGDLLYACNENRLVEYKGFGLKTQQTIQESLEYFIASKGLFHLASVVDYAEELLQLFSEYYPDEEHRLVGDIARKMPEIKGIEIITTASDIDTQKLNIEKDEEGKDVFRGYPVYIDEVDPDMFGTEIFMRNSSEIFIEASGLGYDEAYAYEEDLLDELSLVFVPYEYRETQRAFDDAITGKVPDLIEMSDIKGVVHNHSTYSDGLHSLQQMTDACIEKGYSYFVISDHSQTAAYAGGLKVEQVQQQWEEIDKINQANAQFKVFKSIESDILGDGSLDYEEDVLKGFDLVIASVHSNLKMDEETATRRLITAIENPYTRILGHPSGRLLLGRTGYPIDYEKMIDAAASNNVCIELNANPQRLDIDWKWIDYALNKGVLISINPDAHSTDQIDYIRYGVYAARKGGLTKEMCLNAKSLEEFVAWIKSGK